MNKEAHKALTKLAQRIDPDYKSWWSIGGDLDRCLICNATFNYREDSGESKIYKHGLQHLKEKNLLPFI